MGSEEARLKAAECAARADDAFDDDTRALFLHMRDAWNRMAETLEFSERDDFSIAA